MRTRPRRAPRGGFFVGVARGTRRPTTRRRRAPRNRPETSGSVPPGRRRATPPKNRVAARRLRARGAHSRRISEDVVRVATHSPGRAGVRSNGTISEPSSDVWDFWVFWIFRRARRRFGGPDENLRGRRRPHEVLGAHRHGVRRRGFQPSQRRDAPVPHRDLLRDIAVGVVRRFVFGTRSRRSCSVAAPDDVPGEPAPAVVIRRVPRHRHRRRRRADQRGRPGGRVRRSVLGFDRERRGGVLGVERRTFVLHSEKRSYSEEVVTAATELRRDERARWNVRGDRDEGTGPPVAARLHLVAVFRGVVVVVVDRRRRMCRCAVFVARGSEFGCWTRGVAASPRGPSQGDGIGAHGHDLEARGRRRRGERVRGGPRAFAERRVGRAVRRAGRLGDGPRSGSPSVGTRPMGSVLGGGDLRPGARAGGWRRRGIGRLRRRRCRNVRVVGGGHGAVRMWRAERGARGYPFSGRDAPCVRATNAEFGAERFRTVRRREPRAREAAERAEAAASVRECRAPREVSGRAGMRAGEVRGRSRGPSEFPRDGRRAKKLRVSRGTS